MKSAALEAAPPRKIAQKAAISICTSNHSYCNLASRKAQPACARSARLRSVLDARLPPSSASYASSSTPPPNMRQQPSRLSAAREYAGCSTHPGALAILPATSADRTGMRHGTREFSSRLVFLPRHIPSFPRLAPPLPPRVQKGSPTFALTPPTPPPPAQTRTELSAAPRRVSPRWSSRPPARCALSEGRHESRGRTWPCA